VPSQSYTTNRGPSKFTFRERENEEPSCLHVLGFLEGPVTSVKVQLGWEDAMLTRSNLVDLLALSFDSTTTKGSYLLKATQLLETEMLMRSREFMVQASS
jgi:hypothetical protein